MYPGTNRLRARHTQGAFFLEVREGAETAQSCNVNNSLATSPINIHNIRPLLCEEKQEPNEQTKQKTRRAHTLPAEVLIKSVCNGD